METFHSWSEASKAEALLLVERGVESRIPSEPSNTGTPDAGGAALAISMSRMCSCVCVCVCVSVCVCVCACPSSLAAARTSPQLPCAQISSKLNLA